MILAQSIVWGELPVLVPCLGSGPLTLDQDRGMSVFNILVISMSNLLILVTIKTIFWMLVSKQPQNYLNIFVS